MFRKFRFIWIFFGVLISVYLFGVWYFNSHFGFRTFLNQEDISLSSVDRLVSERMRSVSHQTFTFVRSDGFSERVTFGDLGIYRSSDFGLASKDPISFRWPITLFRDTYLKTSDHLDYDPNVLKERLQELDCVNTEYKVSPSPAKVEVKNGVVSVVPGTFGTEIDLDRLFSVVCDHILQQDFVVDLSLESCYLSDEIPDHTGVLFPISNLLVSCTLDLGCGVFEEIPDEVLDSAVSDGQLSYDIIMAYVKSLKEKYDTIQTNRPFRTHDGRSLLLKPSEQDTFLGWDLDLSWTCANVCNALLSDKPFCEAVWRSFGYSHGDSDFGSVYLELNLSEQHLYFWENGKSVFDCPVVTGLDTDVCRTPSGMFRMLDFCTDYLMTGYYGSAHVNWFVRLTPDGVGIHDADWRSDFSSDVYLTDGSHGCINLGTSDMKSLYDLLSDRYLSGIPVIIY